MAIKRKARIADDYYKLRKEDGTYLNGGEEYQVEYSKTENETEAGDPYNEDWSKEVESIQSLFANFTLYKDANDWASSGGGGSYSIDDKVSYNDLLYKNLTGNNTDTTPDLDTTNWEYQNQSNWIYYSTNKYTYKDIDFIGATNNTIYDYSQKYSNVTANEQVSFIRVEYNLTDKVRIFVSEEFDATFDIEIIGEIREGRNS